MDDDGAVSARRTIATPLPALGQTIYSFLVRARQSTQEEMKGKNASSKLFSLRFVTWSTVILVCRSERWERRGGKREVIGLLSLSGS